MKKRVLSTLAATGLAATMLVGCGGGGGGGGDEDAMNRCIDYIMTEEDMERDAAEAVCDLFRELDRGAFNDEFGS
ncbi:MAG: hypothetical protein FWD83_09105 [Promicromonosporaceae bacterium]|nr:hypothetical protein [Promicromonosporaceae bacterium]